MHVFSLVIISLLITSAVEMSQATTGEFRRCFPEWVNASQIRVSCKENDTILIQIAQYCDDRAETCREMNKSGVSLEKDQDGLCLTINNNTYDSWSCEAATYDDNEQKENFTVDFSNQPTHTSSNQETTDTSLSQEPINTSALDAPSNKETDDNSLSQEHINTSPGPDTSTISEQWPIAGVIIGSIGLIVLIGLIGWCIYKKQQDMEMEERGETGESEPMQDREMKTENEVLGEKKELIENGELGENGEPLALGQNGQQGSRQAKKIDPCATSSML